MINFELDERLKEDCHILLEEQSFYLLLMDNVLIPWFILVPKTDKTELFQLTVEQQRNYLEQTNCIAAFISSDLKADKINIGAIGNIVKQLHIHIIGRFINDPYWPGVVWGRDQKQAYSKKEFENLKQQFISFWAQT
ncbi:MAG: HIT family protein [Gammaproteobacteria bacterium]|nr:HIT family protein [Gammaproteobacteria bacterium]